jgi:DNA-binding IclR family transcriptional regulator
MAREIQSLARGLDTLTMLANQAGSMGVTEVAQALDVDKSSAFRLLSTLASRGFVEQDEETRRYRPGLQIVELARQVLDRIELRAVAKPLLRQLRDRVDESAHLAVTSEGHVVYVDAEESGATLNVNTEIGRHAPLHCTAIGKALIAYLSPKDMKRIIEQSRLKRYTPRTITTIQELIPHLEAVRKRGYAVDDEEFEPGVRCVAAPIRDYRDRVVACVGISGPSVRVSLDRVPEIGAATVETAEAISRLLGHRQP